MNLAETLNARANQENLPESDIGVLLDQRSKQTANISHEGMTHLTSSNPNPLTLQQFGKNILGGTIKGASQIGATLLTPADYLATKAGYDPNRREQVTQGMTNAGVDVNSPEYKVSQLGSEVAGTAGLPGVVAKGAEAFPILSKIIPGLSNSIASGGMTLGNTSASLLPKVVSRTLGGAITGGSTAALVDPSTTMQGMEAGAALPVGTQLLGSTGSLITKGIRKGITGIQGTLTGTGGKALDVAYQAGKDADKTFIPNLMSKVPATDVLDNLSSAVNQMRIDRSNAYRSGMMDISKDATNLDISPINQAVSDLQKTGNYKGFVTNKNALGVVDDITNTVNDFSSKIPDGERTPEAFDALKKAIGDIRDSTQFGTPSRLVADQMYNNVKNQIVKQSPTYAEVMKNYSEASDQLKEITKAFSLGEKASADTAMRKLQSVLRNNVTSNYGNRGDLLNQVENQTGVNIAPQLAGQQLNSWMPRGMVGAIEKGGSPLVVLTHPETLLPIIAGAPFASPKLMGLVNYGAGRLSRIPSSIGNGLMDLGNSALQNSPMQGLLGHMPSAQELQALKTVAPSLAFSQ